MAKRSLPVIRRGMGTEVLAERDLDLLRIKLIMYLQPLICPVLTSVSQVESAVVKLVV